MNSLRKIKMKKEPNLLSSTKEVGKVRASLEKATSKAFGDFAKSKQKAREMAHLKYLD